MSYKNYNWEVIAHDYNSPYLRNNLWVRSFYKYTELLNVPRIFLGILSKNNQIEYLVDISTWSKSHDEVKKRVLKDFNFFEELIEESIERGENMNSWTEDNIFKKDLTKIDGGGLIALLKEFIEIQEDLNVYGTILPVLDFLNFSFIEDNLNRIIKENISEKDAQDFYSVFTEPEENSFFQDQEEGLLDLISSYWGHPEWKKDILNNSLDLIKDKHPEFYNKLLSHSDKYGWVYYIYMGPAFNESDFYSFVVDYIREDIDPKIRLEEIKKRKNLILRRKKDYLSKINVSDLDSFILRMASRVVWAKPRRKDYQSKSYYHAEKLCREIAKRLFSSIDQVRSTPVEVLEKALNGEEVDLSIANDIQSFHACLPNDDGTVTTLVGDEAKHFSEKILKRAKKEKLYDINEISGATACPGRASGEVKIINIPEDMGKMNLGDILVSSATSPNIVSAMKKASAILTDEGGLTCHAAIVSRELGIPCVVGLKFVTQALKDGDEVEVDADKGVVKILKRK